MEKTLIRNTSSKPTKVLEHDDVHYFYWPVELGIGHVKIWKFRMPYFPVKFLDYEPVKVVLHNERFVVISRFHYRILTYFNRPVTYDGRPIVDFSFGSHTPVIVTNINENIHQGADERFPHGVDAREIAAFEALLGILRMILSRGIKYESEEWVTYELSLEEVPPDCILRTSDMLAIVWLGNVPTHEEFDTIGYHI